MKSWGREIPKGWEDCEIIELFQLQRRFDLPFDKRVAGRIPIYAASGLANFHNEAKVNGPAIITGRSGTIGEVFYIGEDCWPLNTTLWVKNFKQTTPLFAYFILKNTELKEFHSGSAVPTLNRNDIHALHTSKPPKALIETFERMQQKMFSYTDKTVCQIKSLNSLKEVVLSKMSKG